jgi:hypothetical protein
LQVSGNVFDSFDFDAVVKFDFKLGNGRPFGEMDDPAPDLKIFQGLVYDFFLIIGTGEIILFYHLPAFKQRKRGSDVFASIAFFGEFGRFQVLRVVTDDGVGFS